MLVRPLSLLALAATAISGAAAAAVRDFSHTSTAEPVPVPYDISKLSLAAGLVQQTYCPQREDTPGLRVGDAELLWTYGDGGDTYQRVNLYHSPSLGLALAIEGTNVSSLRSDSNDVLFLQEDPNPVYAHYFPPGTKLMHGFQDAYVRLMDAVFVHIHKFMAKKNESRVTIIGHSLGAAMGLIASADLDNRLDQGIYKSYLFGLPRVGNQVFADYVDHRFGHKLHWVVNGRDWVPRVPPRALGYQHPSNYVWINPGNSTHWKMYPGQENVHGWEFTVPALNFDDHQGIYFHTQIGTSIGHCPALVGQDGW